MTGYVELKLLPDGTSDLLLSDAEGVPVAEPYDREVVKEALERITQTVARRYREVVTYD